MSTNLPPIYRDCRRLLLLTEEVVRRFSRYHKYTVVTDLRQQASHVQALVWHAGYFYRRYINKVRSYFLCPHQ